MLSILPGDHLWDRFRVERVEPAGCGFAWLSPLSHGKRKTPGEKFLLVSFAIPRRAALQNLLAALEPVFRTPGDYKRGSHYDERVPPGFHRVPFIGNVQWIGSPERNGMALLHIRAQTPIPFLLRKSIHPAAVTVLAMQASDELNDLCKLIAARAPAQHPDAAKWLGSLLNPETLGISKHRAAFCLRDAPAAAEAGAPRFADFVANEILRAEPAGEAALVFGITRLTAHLLLAERSNLQWTWSDVAQWASGRLDLSKILLKSAEALAPFAPLFRRGLNRAAPRRFATLAKLTDALRKVEAQVASAPLPHCSECELILAQPVSVENSCPCCGFAGTPAAIADASPPSRKKQAAPPPPVPDDMKLVPAGAYLSGERKIPRTLRAFAMHEKPVTESQFKAYLAESGKKPRAKGPGSRPAKYDKHPVVNATWYEANEFAEHFGLRLPTTHEWEKAARGVDGRKFPFGNEFKPETGNIRAPTEGGVQRGPRETAPAGNYLSGASPYGILDMAGNVLEWTSSARRGGERIFRAVKGACYMDGSSELARCTSVQYFPPENGEAFIGFRCVKDLV